MTKILSLGSHVASAAIVEIAQQRLHQSPYFFLKSLRCQFNAGVLTLRGRVPYRQLRQFAESIVSRVEGVERVDNRVEVVDPVFGATAVQAVRNAG